MNTPVSFELSKLLKEKGFDLKVRSMYCEGKLFKDTNSKGNYNNVVWVRTWRSSPTDDTISAPTIAEVVMWLYEKHGIWISVTTIKWNYEQDIVRFAHHICKFNRKDVSEILNSSYVYDTPTEAYSQAIDYALKNLI